MSDSNNDLTLEQHHEQLRDDLAGHALGALDAAAAARVEEHLASCAECRQSLTEYQQVLQLLPLGLPATQPSPASRTLLMARTRTTGRRDERTSKRSRAPWWPRVRLGLAGATIAALLALGITAWQRADEPRGHDEAALVEDIRNSPNALAMPMAGSESAPGATANLFIELGETDAALIANGLPQPPDGHAYQFWFVRPDSTRISGGVFDVDRTGGAVTLLSAPTEFSNGWSCGVSEEPVSGSDAPTGRNILRATYDANYQYTR